MPVEYPATLPPPSSYRFRARERRAMSAGDGTQQARTRTRDVIVDAQAIWRYSPAQMETWRLWYENELLWGQRLFAVPLPGYGGEQVRVARYVSPVSRRHAAAGNFEVSADLEVRGRSALPTGPSAAAPPIGWLSDAKNLSTTAAHANSGTQNRAFDVWDLYAGVVGYASQTVAWSLTWSPLSGGPSPTLIPLSGGKVQVDWPYAAGNAFFPSLGLLTLTATIDGVPVAVGQRLQAATNSSSYQTQSWGPEP